MKRDDLSRTPPSPAPLLVGGAVDMDALHELVARHGVDSLLAELRADGRSGAEVEEGSTLRDLLGVLDLEAQNLRGWGASKEPAFFLQQVRNRCFEQGLLELQTAAEQALARRRWPYLRERTVTDRQAAIRIRTIEPSPDPPGFYRNRAIGGVALTLDARVAVAACCDKTLKLWDLSTGRLLGTLSGHSDEVRGVALIDGQRLISASIDRTLKVWSLHGGSELLTLHGHRAGVWAVAVSGDGQRAVSAAMDATLMLWSLSTGENLRTFQGHGDPVLGVALTPDGRRMVSASMDGTLKEWSLETGRVERTFEGHRAGVWCVALSPDGARAVSGSSDRDVLVWDLERGEVVHALSGHAADVTAVQWIGDTWAVSGSLDGTVKIWDMSALRLAATWTGRGAGVNGIAVSRDHDVAVSVARDGALEVWSPRSAIERSAGRLPTPHSTPGAASGSVLRDVAVSPGGRWALAVAEDGSLKVLDLRGDGAIRTLAAHRGSERGVRDVRQVRVSEDGTRGVTVSADGTATVWDLETGEGARSLICHGQASQVALSADARRAVSPGHGGALEVWDVMNGRVERRVPEAGLTAYYLMLSGDGRRALTVFWEPVTCRCRVWDLASGELIQMFPAGSAPIAVSFDGRRAVISTPSYTSSDKVDVWDLDAGSKLCTAVGRWKMALSWDGRKMASADGDLVVTDAVTGARLARAAPAVPFSCCAFTPDGRTLVAGDRSGVIHLLDG